MAFTSLGNSTLAVSILFPLLAVIAIILRAWARIIKKAAFGWDDWLAVVATVLCLAAGILNIWGVCVHALAVPFEILESDMGKFVIFQKIVFINPSILMPALAFVKISILCFYKRIFIQPAFQKAANVLIVISILWGIATFFCQIFEQFPVSDNWTTDLSGAHTNFVLNYGEFLMAWSSLDLVLDVVILCMPAFAIRSLHLETKKKLLLIGIFGLGALCVVSEGVRIYYQWVFLFEPNMSTEILYGSIISNILIWSTIEPCVSVIASCLPTLGPIFLHGESAETMIHNVRSFFSLRSAFNRSTSQTDRMSRKQSQESEAPTWDYKSSQRLYEEWKKMHTNGEAFVLSNLAVESKSEGINVQKTFASQSNFA